MGYLEEMNTNRVVLAKSGGLTFQKILLVGLNHGEAFLGLLTSYYLFYLRQDQLATTDKEGTF